MAQLIIEIPDAVAADMRDKMYALWGGPPTIGGNPVNNTQKMAFIKSYVAGWLKDQYIVRIADLAGDTARAASLAANGSIAIQ